MNKRIAIPLGAAILLGAMTSSIAAAVSPGVLRVTGPVLCATGSEFVVRESPEQRVLPDDRRVAPLHFACVATSGRESEPNLGSAVFVLFLAATAIWWALLAWMVRRLMDSAGKTG